MTRENAALRELVEAVDILLGLFERREWMFSGPSGLPAALAKLREARDEAQRALGGVP